MRKIIVIASLVLFAAATTAPSVVMAANDAPADKQDQPKAKKRVAKKQPPRETDEQKARRIGEKYGVTW